MLNLYFDYKTNLIRLNKGYYMSAHVLLNLLNELSKCDKMQGLPSILSLFCKEYNKFNNTRARMLDSIYYMTLRLLRSKYGCKDQESIQSSTTPDLGYQWESDKLTVDTTNESQEVSPFPAGDHKAHINRRAQKHSKHKTEQKHKKSTKEVPRWNGQ